MAQGSVKVFNNQIQTLKKHIKQTSNVVALISGYLQIKK